MVYRLSSVAMDVGIVVVYRSRVVKLFVGVVVIYRPQVFVSFSIENVCRDRGSLSPADSGDRGTVPLTSFKEDDIRVSYRMCQVLAK